MSNPHSSSQSAGSLDDCRILILTGAHAGEEGICLGKSTSGQWAVSPDSSNQILELKFESEFALLLDLHANPAVN